MHLLPRPLAALAVVAASALLPTAGLAQARSFSVAGGSRIQFVSDAPLERITGTSTTVTGSVSVDPSDLSTASGSIRVPITSIGTGDGLRDEHLHGDGWLDATAHPDAIFEITRVEGATALAPNEVVNVTLHGRFTIHGATHEISARAQVRYLPAEGETPALLRAQARFSVELPDYGVSVNPLVRLKVSDHIEVNVTIRCEAR
jgi:polyisoprenoid-binding protein YceI